MGGEQLPGDRTLERREPDARGSVAAQQELVQPIAQAADAIVEDDGCRSAPSRCFHFGSYFQLRLLPSDSHPTAVAIRFCRVASVFASVTHSTYSRL